MNEILKKTLDQHKDEYIEHLRNLIRCDTECIGHGILGGKEKAGQEYMENLLRQMNADVIEIDQMSEDVMEQALKEHQEGNLGHNYDGRWNVYSTFKGTNPAAKSIMFNGHMDTMPAGDKSLWSNDPHAADIVGDRIIGVGSCDMKGGLMASLMAVQLLKDAGIPLPGDVKYTFVADEEGGGNGSIQAAMRGQKADGVVICEPSNKEIMTAHSGFIFFKVEFEGIACHSGAKWMGVSAIEKAVKVMGALDELEHHWLVTYKHALLPPPTGNVGVIEGGKAGSTVADYCCFKTCVHYLPGVQTHDSVVKDYMDAINLCCDGDAWLKDHRPKVSIYQAGGAFEEETTSDFAVMAKAAFEEASGKKIEFGGALGGNDARVWKNIAGCHTVGFGPGMGDVCHAVGEYLKLEDYLEAILVYAQMILDWCK